MTAARETMAVAGSGPIGFAKMAIIGGLLVAVGPISLTLYGPAMPAIAADLGVSAGDVKLTVSAYFLGFALAQLVCGPLSDAFGRRPVLIAFTAIYALGSLACSLSDEIGVLIAARILQGIGASAGIALTRAMVRDGFIGQDSARLLNLIGICLAIGPAVSPSLGAGLLMLFDWHSVFFAMLVLGLVLMAVVVLAVPETSRTFRRERARPSVIAANFAEVLAQAGFWKAALIVGTSLGGLYAFASILPFVLIETFDLTPLQYAWVMLLQTGSYLATAILLRPVLRAVPELKVASAGVVCIIVAGLLFTAPLWLEHRLWLVMLPIPLWAAGIAMIMPGTTTAALAPFPHVAGAASALLGFFQVGGGLAGSFAASLVASHDTALATVIPIMALICGLALVLLPWPPSATDDRRGGAGEGGGLDSGSHRT